MTSVQVRPDCGVLWHPSGVSDPSSFHYDKGIALNATQIAKAGCRTASLRQSYGGIELDPQKYAVQSTMLQRHALQETP